MANQYPYFQEEIDSRFPEPLFDELDLNIFVDAYHVHNKVMLRSIKGVISVAVLTPTTWLLKRQTPVQTSTFRAKFTALKKAVEEAIMLRYHLRYMVIKVRNPSPIFVDNMSVVLNANNPWSSLNNKPLALIYHFVIEHVSNDVVEVRKNNTKEKYAYPFTKALVSNYFHGFYH